MKQCTEIQPRLWQALYQLYKVNASLPKDEVIQKISAALQLYNFKEDWALNTATTFYNMMCRTNALSQDVESMSEKEAVLSLLDIRQLHVILEKEQDIRAKKLLVSFAVYSRVYPHHSHWIHYDKKVITYLSSVNKLKASEIESLTNYLHQTYNLNMQVVGSTQPMPCFKLEWQATQPEPSAESEENPLVHLGPLTPSTINDFVDSLTKK